MLPLRDVVSILPQISLAAAGAVVANSTSTSISTSTNSSLAAAVADTFRNGNIDINNSNCNSFSSFNDAAASLLLSLLPTINARTLHKLLVASNLFWYQAIRQTVAVLSVLMCQEFAAMDTSQQAQLIAAPSVGNIFTQAIGGLVIAWLPGGTKSAITIALIGLATGCTMLPLAIGSAHSNSNSNSNSGSFPLGPAFALLSLQGFLFGPMFPSHSVLLSKWLPPNERGSAMAYGEIAMSIASMGVPLVVTSIAEHTTTAKSAVVGAAAAATTATGTSSSVLVAGWRNGFYVTGMACFGYLIAWIVLGRNEPESCSYISRKELALIQSIQKKSVRRNTHDSKDKTKTKTKTKHICKTKDSDSKHEKDNSLSWQKVLLHPSILSLFFVHMVYNFVTLSVNSWMPTYYNDVLKLNPNDAKLHIVLPQLTALVVKLCVSKFAAFVRKVRAEKMDSNSGSGSGSDISSSSDDRLVILFSRRFMGYLGFVVMALPLYLLPMVASSSSPSMVGSSTTTATKKILSWYAPSPWWSTGLFSVALAGTGFHAESFRANYLDVTEQHVGLVSGVGNCLSSVSAMLAPFCVGTILRRTSGDWSPVWRISALASLIAAVVFGSCSTTTPVEEGGAA